MFFNSNRNKHPRQKGKRVRFCTDYQENPGDDYIKLSKDDGWELIWARAFGWYIWRKTKHILTEGQVFIQIMRQLSKI